MTEIEVQKGPNEDGYESECTNRRNQNKKSQLNDQLSNWLLLREEQEQFEQQQTSSLQKHQKMCTGQTNLQNWKYLHQDIRNGTIKDYAFICIPTKNLNELLCQVIERPFLLENAYLYLQNRKRKSLETIQRSGQSQYSQPKNRQEKMKHSIQKQNLDQKERSDRVKAQQQNKNQECLDQNQLGSKTKTNEKIPINGMNSFRQGKRKRRIIFVGDSDVGKSSLLNNLWNLSLKIGLGGCTEKVEKISEDADSEIYDSPGSTDETQYNYIQNSDIIFLLYDVLHNRLEKIVRFAQEKQKEIIFVRTKCDLNPQRIDRQQLRSKDQEILKRWGVHQPKIYLTSCKKMDKSNEYQNNLIRKSIQNHKRSEIHEGTQLNNRESKSKGLKKENEKGDNVVIKQKNIFKISENSQKKSAGSFISLSKQEVRGRTGKKYAFVGQSSVGKSSLLNRLFGSRLKTGMGGCTTAEERVPIQGTPIEVYDTPALPSQSAFAAADAAAYEFTLKYDVVLVLFEASLKSVERFVRWAAGRGKEMVFVRTKCECFGPGQYKSLREELESDCRLLKSWGINAPFIYSSSSSPNFQNSFDNEKVKLLVTNKLNSAKDIQDRQELKLNYQNQRTSISIDYRLRSNKFSMTGQSRLNHCSPSRIATKTVNTISEEEELPQLNGNQKRGIDNRIILHSKQEKYQYSRQNPIIQNLAERSRDNFHNNPVSFKVKQTSSRSAVQSNEYYQIVDFNIQKMKSSPLPPKQNIQIKQIEEKSSQNRSFLMPHIPMLRADHFIGDFYLFLCDSHLNYALLKPQQNKQFCVHMDRVYWRIGELQVLKMEMKKGQGIKSYNLVLYIMRPIAEQLFSLVVFGSKQLQFQLKSSSFKVYANSHKLQIKLTFKQALMQIGDNINIVRQRINVFQKLFIQNIKGIIFTDNLSTFNRFKIEKSQGQNRIIAARLNK